MRDPKEKVQSEIRRRVIALLSREEIEFLDKISTDSSFSTGYKLSRMDIIGALVDAAMALGISAMNVGTTDELLARFLELTRSGVDRRRFPRIRKSLGAEFRVMDSLKNHEMAFTEDISLGGFRMEVSNLKEPLFHHQVIEVTLTDPGDGIPVQAIGKVAWIQPKDGVEGFEIGVNLIHVKKEHRERLLRFLNEDKGPVAIQGREKGMMK